MVKGVKDSELEKVFDHTTAENPHCPKSSCVCGDRNVTRSRRWRRQLHLVLTTPLNVVVHLYRWAECYSGAGAPFVNLIAPLMQLAVLSYPGWSFVLALVASQAVGEPLNFAIYIVWCGQWFPLVAYLAYTEHK